HVGDWVDVDILDYAGVEHRSDLTLDFGSVDIASADELAKGWAFSNQSTFYVNPIPEPATFSLLGLGLFAMGATMRKRKA
ncbi:MAG: PEP-CTERM sorting domain-containing protein, partial [Methyloprofundus sp.]|nr:PEP-CTERM sorting domain-containing protein [Methyloprofundus sp.]